MVIERHEPFCPEEVSGNEKKPNKTLLGSTGLTVAIGVAMAGMAIYHFRAKVSPPEIIQVPGGGTIIPPPSSPPVPTPPQVQTIPSLPALPMPEPEEKEVIPSSWDGIWRREKYPIPLFQFLPTPEGTAGNLIGNWTPMMPFKVGSMEDDRIEFFVQDDIFRVHFRFVLKEQNKAEVFGWITDEDWVVAFANGTRKVRTPQQAALVRIVMEGNGMQAMKIFKIGIFERREELKIGKPRAFPGVIIPDVPVAPFVPVAPLIPQPPPPPVIIPRFIPNRGMPLPPPNPPKKPNPPPKDKDHKGRGGRGK
jgi:hypothetical protein